MKMNWPVIKCLAPFMAVLAMTVAVPPCTATAQEIPESHRLKALPADARELKPTLRSGKPGDSIIVRGRIGTGDATFANDRAEFVLLDDAAVAAEAAKQEGGQRNPTLVPENRAVVRLVDSKGTTIGYSLKGRSGLKDGAEVFIAGKLVSAAAGDEPAIIHATGLFVPRVGMPAGILLEPAPADAKDVVEAKKDLKKGDRVTLKGRIGGSKQPFIKERAVFTIVGRGLKACNEMPGDKCAMPWDYCCDPREEILKHSATIQVVDNSGAPLRTDIRGRWGIKELSEVIVVGTVAEVRGNALIVNAEKLHVVQP